MLRHITLQVNEKDIKHSNSFSPQKCSKTERDRVDFISICLCVRKHGKIRVHSSCSRASNDRVPLPSFTSSMSRRPKTRQCCHGLNSHTTRFTQCIENNFIASINHFDILQVRGCQKLKKMEFTVSEALLVSEIATFVLYY